MRLLRCEFDFAQWGLSTQRWVPSTLTVVSSSRKHAGNYQKQENSLETILRGSKQHCISSNKFNFFSASKSDQKRWSVEAEVADGKEEIEREFEKFGTLSHVWVAFNPPGFAFITFENEHEAQSAVDHLNGSERFGTKLRVEVSRSRGRGGGGRGGGRRDFGGGGGRGGGGRSDFGGGRPYDRFGGGGGRDDHRGGGGGPRQRSRSPPGQCDSFLFLHGSSFDKDTTTTNRATALETNTRATPPEITRRTEAPTDTKNSSSVCDQPLLNWSAQDCLQNLLQLHEKTNKQT
ncbi:Hypothetical predicted protein [Cloeon dipterum]|uniref:RRM domain-containing protein n=1 Tax=Cloeon dipterum TaxID=197152 RepID=A0A8S1BTE3_9INSE|nr:Hypothetical predicted protein [Cloeon dipterum]